MTLLPDEGVVQEDSHGYAPSHRSQVSRQTTSTPVVVQQSIIVVSNGRKNLFTKGVPVFPTQMNFSHQRRVVDNMKNQTEKSVHKVFPSSLLFFQATGKQFTVKIGHREQA